MIRGNRIWLDRISTSYGTQPSVNNNCPASWSPDNRKIAFCSYRDGNHEIYVMNADGSNLTRLTNNKSDDDYPTWSPDGSKIAFCSERDGREEIYVMNSDGSNLTRLTKNDSFDKEPNWSR